MGTPLSAVHVQPFMCPAIVSSCQSLRTQDIVTLHGWLRDYRSPSGGDALSESPPPALFTPPTEPASSINLSVLRESSEGKIPRREMLLLFPCSPFSSHSGSFIAATILDPFRTRGHTALPSPLVPGRSAHPEPCSPAPSRTAGLGAAGLLRVC